MLEISETYCKIETAIGCQHHNLTIIMKKIHKLAEIQKRPARSSLHLGFYTYHIIHSTDFCIGTYALIQCYENR